MARSLTDGTSYLSQAAALKDWNDSVALAKAFGVLKSTGPVRHCRDFNQVFTDLVDSDLDYRPGHEPVAFDGMPVMDLPTRTVSWQFYHNPDREARRRELHCADIRVQRPEPGSAPHLAQAFKPAPRSEFARLLAATPMPDAKSIKDVKHAKN